MDSFPVLPCAAFPLSVYVRDEAKGRGVFTLCAIPSDVFVLEYRGELLTGRALTDREQAYDHASLVPSKRKRKRNLGSYMFYFRHLERWHWYSIPPMCIFILCFLIHFFVCISVLMRRLTSLVGREKLASSITAKNLPI